MNTVAVFMGAGASYPFGFPLTKDFFPIIKEKLDRGTLFGADGASRAELKSYLSTLLPGFDDRGIKIPPELDIKELQLPYVTDILSLIDHSLHVSNSLLPSKSARELIRFRTLVERAIFEALDWPYDPLNEDEIPRPLADLTKWLMGQRKTGGKTVGIISSNYDIAVETELFKIYAKAKIEEEFDFGFCWREPVGMGAEVYKRPLNPSFRLYKLHGSLNWLRCEMCDHTYINKKGVIAHHSFDNEISPHNTCHCRHAPLRSVIVAPSLVRDIRDVNLLEVWKNTVELLRTASEWVIIGYSFPPEDIAIRSLFIRAFQGRTVKPEIKIIQSVKDKEAFSRFKLFFPKCEYATGGLEAFLSAELGASKN